jgi:hypothetical protein
MPNVRALGEHISPLIPGATEFKDVKIRAELLYKGLRVKSKT